MPLSPGETAALIRGTKKKDITVTQAVQAATHMEIASTVSINDQCQGIGGKIASMSFFFIFISVPGVVNTQPKPPTSPES